MPGVRVPLQWRAEARANLDSIVRRFFTHTQQTRHNVFVCHGNLIRALVCKIMNIRLSKWLDLPIYHASITRFAVDAYQEKKLVSFNETGHLAPRLYSGSGLED